MPCWVLVLGVECVESSEFFLKMQLILAMILPPAPNIKFWQKIVMARIAWFNTIWRVDCWLPECGSGVEGEEPGRLQARAVQDQQGSKFSKTLIFVWFQPNVYNTNKDRKLCMYVKCREFTFFLNFTTFRMAVRVFLMQYTWNCVGRPILLAASGSLSPRTEKTTSSLTR